MVYEFSTTVKELCWEVCKKVRGRDPARWRQDANGTPVMEALRGKEGLSGWHYDHTTPKSLANKMPEDARAKLAELSNCQILQSRANKKKQNKVLGPDVLKRLACDLELTDSEMDVVELAVLGNVTDEMGRVKCMCVSKEEANLYSGVPPCATNICKESHDFLERLLTRIGYNQHSKANGSDIA